MKSRVSFPIVAVSLVLSVLASNRLHAAQLALLSNEPALPAPAVHALADLRAALAAKDLSVTEVANRAAAEGASARGLIEILPVQAGEQSGFDKPESYRIVVKRDGRRRNLTVSGSDAVGLMYGIFELAEQVSMARGKGNAVWKALHDASGAPALAFRADNPFLSLETPSGQSDAGSPLSPWFYDEGFWRGYFDTLARNRFNVCDFHAMHSFETTGFPNLLPYFLVNPDRPEASWLKTNPWRNLAMLNRIIDLAENRGVHVALMTYSMDFPNIDVGDEETQIAHTSWAVSEILKRCPKLWMFGFRIGESGKSESFFERSFLDGIKRSKKEDVRLYTRTWGAEFKDLAQIGMAYPENFYIEIKYNGEHLGAPYNAIQGRWGSYSYQTYLNYPRYWKIIWQVRANGTHRLFPWFDPDFARRCVRANSFGGAIGFTLESLTTYYTQDPNRIFRKRSDADFLEYAYERYWAWYLTWGRLAYDPETSDDVFHHAFEQRFGAKSGEQVHDLLNLASRIVPLIYRHHCLGPDHRNMAPEFETGNNSSYRPWQTTVQNIDTFARVGVLDPKTHLSAVQFVDEYLAGRLDGKVTPLDAAARLDVMAEQCLARLEKTQVKAAQKEWKLLARDVRALAHLARYYAAKDRAAVAMQFYDKTGDVSQVVAAREEVQRAKTHWRNLDAVTFEQYRPVLDRLRMDADFTWDKLMPDLEADLARVDEVISAIERGDGPTRGHVPVRRAVPGKDLELTVGVAGLSEPKVLLRYAIDDGAEQTAECVLAGRWTFKAIVPRAQLRQGGRGRYSFAVSSDGAPETPVSTSATDADKAESSFVVTSDREGPAIAWGEVEADRKARVVRVHCRIEDPSGVARARLEWKPMPSETPWQEPIALQQSGDSSDFQAEIPLTAEGVLYSAVAIDAAGNATRYPDMRLETPYVAVDPWDPGLPADMALASMGETDEGLKGRVVNWPDVTRTGRPGTFYEYAGPRGTVSFSFNVERLSDNVLTLGRVVHAGYGTADILVDGKKIGVLEGHQDGPGYLPAREDILVRGLAAGAHTLSFALAKEGRFGFEGFKLTPQPAIIENFVISQSFGVFPGDKGKDMYPIGKPGMTWKPAATDSRGVVALHSQLKPNEDCHAFAATKLRCEKPIETHLLIGTNDGCYVWLNGKLIHSRPGKRYFAHNGDRVPVSLKEGDNLLVLLVMQAGRYWLFNVNSESYAVTSHRPDLARP